VGFEARASIEVTTSGYCGRNYTIEFELAGDVNKRFFEIVYIKSLKHRRTHVKLGLC
jgi:hypothetical protein